MNAKLDFPEVIRFAARAMAFFLGAFASTLGADEQSPLEPSPLMKHETQWLVQALEQAHYNKVKLEDLNATMFLDSYLKKLDGQKIYFTAIEIDQIQRNFSPAIKTYFLQGDLFPAFEIFNAYRVNAIRYLDKALERIDQPLALDGNETYLFDRSEEFWAKNEKELVVLWDKLIRNEIIGEITGKSDANGSVDDFIESQGEKSTVDARSVLKERYSRWKKNVLEFEPEDVQEIYLSALTQSFDPHTTFMNLKEKEKFDQAMNNEFVGIGAVLTDVGGFCTIKELLPGGPAEASRQLEPEDIILKVAQSQGPFVDVVDMKLSKIVDLIKGPKDTIVRLEIRPIKSASTTKVVSIVRDKIKLTDRLASASLHKVDGDSKELMIGVIELPSFYGSSGQGPKATDDVEELIVTLKDKNIDGLILDLRRNGGGYLSEAVNLAGLFISRGPVVQVKSTDGKIRKKFDFDPKLVWNQPLIILASRYSASASEIVAGALKNHKRAIVVGDSATHGKGTVQSLLQMNLPFNFMQSSKKGSAAKITIQKYYLPSGESTQIFGVKSDVSLPSVNEFLPIGESDLDNALEWDSIPQVSHRRPENEFAYRDSEVEEIARLSGIRQKNEPEFAYLRKNIDLFKARKNRKSSTLDLKTRLAEKMSDANQTEQLKKLYESFDEISFPQSKIQLKIVQDQIAKSKLARGIQGADEENVSDGNFSIPDSLDIGLHESLRIMSDWVTLREKSPLSKNSFHEADEI